MRTLAVTALILMTTLFAQAGGKSNQRFYKVKDFQMSDNRGNLYVVLTNNVHVDFYPLSLYLHSNCSKKKQEWKETKIQDMIGLCDVDFEMTKINKQGTVLSVYVQKTDDDYINSPQFNPDEDPKCLRPEWMHIKLDEICSKK